MRNGYASLLTFVKTGYTCIIMRKLLITYYKLQAIKGKLLINFGFTFLEVIIALAILTSGILGVVSLILVTTRSLTFTKDQTIAAHLAQEGVEIVRSIRDTNWITGEDFNEGLIFGDYCADYLSSVLSSCFNFQLSWDGTGYSHEAGLETAFSRRIHIENGTDGQGVNFINAQTTVSWGDSNSISAQDRLYDWR